MWSSATNHQQSTVALHLHTGPMLAMCVSGAGSLLDRRLRRRTSNETALCSHLDAPVDVLKYCRSNF